MSSINEQQPEQNHLDLAGGEAVAKIKELVKQAETGFFSTSITTGRALSTRPMAVQEVDDRGSLWFLSASDSQQNKELARDPKNGKSEMARNRPRCRPLSGLAPTTWASE